MTSEEFRQEVRNSNICPGDFERDYKEFQNYQETVAAVFREFHRVSEKHRILYEMAYGSLLGVIRDGGQIPWDYDMDLIVPFSEKERLIAALEQDLDKRFYYYCPDSAPGCRHMIMRLAPVEYRSEVLHLDIFFLTGTPEDPDEREAFIRRIKEISGRRYGRNVNVREEAAGDFHRYLTLMYHKKLPHFLISKRTLAAEFEEYKALCGRYSPYEATHCILADVFADWYLYPTAWMWDTTLMETSYGTVRIPTHYEEILKAQYGDYMQIPSLEARIGELMYRYNKLRLHGRRKQAAVSGTVAEENHA